MQVDYSNVICILGNVQSCFVCETNGTVSQVECSLAELQLKLKESNFIRVNNYTLINTRFVINSKSKRIINLKGGSMHKVSRKFRKCIM